MIFLNNYSDITNYIKNEKSFLKSDIKVQENLKNIISKYIQNFANSNDNIELDAINLCLTFLENLKNALSLCNENIENIQNILTNLNDIDKLSKNNNDLSSAISSFNLEYLNLKQKILKNTLKIQECLYAISEKSSLNFSCIEEINKSEYNTQKMQIENITNTIKENEKYIENTLIISNDVILPYTISKLKEILEKNHDKYSSIDDVILNEYTLPISLFKNPIIARFKGIIIQLDKLEFVCDVEKVKKVIEELRKSHPYEEPAIDIIPLIDESEFK